MSARNRASVMVGMLLASGFGIGLIVGGAAMAAGPKRVKLDSSILGFDPFQPSRPVATSIIEDPVAGPTTPVLGRPPVRDPFRPPTRSPYVPRPPES